ncbi:sulfate adenylyltransferase (ADP) / ATP adenylyltransferase [Alternaria panax]|uniref:Sulfate adenylyltransferase (ADP) / ATP adenylyltransferase n=1 Tax=Alternaria panax TaxID=48097 RepID=A0AAD4I3R9_9PLEO|nr:sulfate adenylyltransferase (ADP) / ATP adenylyltransferase [Alternaria panax]
MSLAHLVHRDCKFDEEYLYRQSLAQLQPCLSYAPEVSPTKHTINFHNRTGMTAQSMTESSYMQTQPWGLQHVEQEDAKPTTAAPTTPNPNIHTYSSGQNWSGGYDTSFDWPHALQQAGTFIVPHSESQFHQNHALVYNATFPTQNTVGKSYGDERTAWASPELSGLPRGLGDRSVLGTSIPLSPKSYVSDEFGNTYTPGSMLDQASPTGDWNGYIATTHSAALTPPSCRPFLAQKIDNDVGLSGLPRTRASMGMTTVPSNSSSRPDPVPIAPLDDDQQSGSEYSHSQHSSAGQSSWYHGDYSYDASNVPYRSQDVATYNNSSSDTSLPATSAVRPTQHRSAPWNDSRPSVHTQSRIQDRLQVPRSAVAQAQREHNDQLLIEGKKRGETYKEIKLKMVGEKPAESTLRGRYRSLTKARKDRLELLDEIVQQEFDRIESNLQNPYSLSYDQKILKVAWKKVAEFIADNGGSYHFGNATCKRRWLERNPVGIAKRKFEAAKASSDLLFSPTELAIIRTSAGIPFQLRYCPSLAKKPLPKLQGATPKQKIDPFENPPPALHLADIPAANPTHFLVLNKFPIIPEHFILATKPNKKQTHVLEQDDLEATHAVLKAWHTDAGDGEERLLAFFNSGDHSGASQPHRHLQFLPVEGMRNSEKAGDWRLLIDSILSSPAAKPTEGHVEFLQHPSLPFTHFAYRFDSEPSSGQLLDIYHRLYDAAKAAVDAFISSNPNKFALHPTDGGDLPISYNLAMTTAGMVILPRRAEGTMLRRDDGSEIGFAALNGTTLGGTMMVKHQDEWDMLREKPGLLDHILSGIGIPKNSPPKVGAPNI